MREYIVPDSGTLLLHGDLPEIVRCRDCVYHIEGDEEYATEDWCLYWENRLYESDGFCAWGESKGALKRYRAEQIAEEAEKRLGGI